MALLDFLQKAKKEKAIQAPKQSLKQAPTPKRQGEKSGAPKGAVLRSSRTAWRLLEKPHVTEKASHLTHLDQYVFRVFDNATKPEVKQAIEGVYGVHVTKVRKISIPGKARRRGRHTGWRAGYTKAIVTLQKGEKIEILPH